jgi:hypothetical protein
VWLIADDVGEEQQRKKNVAIAGHLAPLGSDDGNILLPLLLLPVPDIGRCAPHACIGGPSAVLRGGVGLRR